MDALVPFSANLSVPTPHAPVVVPMNDARLPQDLCALIRVEWTCTIVRMDPSEVVSDKPNLELIRYCFPHLLLKVWEMEQSCYAM